MAESVADVKALEGQPPVAPGDRQPLADRLPASTADEVDPWAWTERDDAQDAQDAHVDISGCRVTAVLVALDAARWLPETLAGLAALRHRPDRLIAVDNHSSDSTRLLLERARDQGLLDAVYSCDESVGFGAAVQLALREDEAAQLRVKTASGRRSGAHRPPPQDRRHGGRPSTGLAAAASHWIWLLHDDAVPEPHALERLLAHVVAEPTIDITGPKLLLPRPRHAAPRISEIGVSISGTGRREVLFDTGEIDQGQRDEPRRRLGVSTCGMLVRQSVWRALGGLDPALPVFRDGVDFGWRAHRAGYSVVTTPRAAFIHRQVGRAGLRPSGLAGRRPGRLDRYLGLLVVAGHASRRRLPLVWLRLVWSCLVRALGYLFGKAPGRSRDELLALGDFLAHPGQIAAFRRRLVRIRPTPGSRRVVRTLRPRWWAGLRTGAEALSAAAAERYRSLAGELEVASLDELTGDDYAAVADERPRHAWLSPAVVVGVLSVVACLVAARDLLGVGSLTAPALLPAQSSVGELWRTVWAPIAGAPGQSPPPWLALVALGSTVFLGRPEWFVTVLLCAVVPISLVTAYPVVRKTISGRRVRLWAAMTYALLPVLLGGTNQGRLSLSVFAIALPLLALAARALVLRRPRTPEAWRGGWGAGVVLVALVAFEPSVLLLALGAGLVGALALRRTPRKAGRVAIALLVPLVVLAPWWPSVVRSWGRLFTGPDAALDGVRPAAQVWQLLLGRDTGAGLPPLWLGSILFGVVWVVALVGLGRRPRARTVLACWLTALLALTMAVLVSRLVVVVPPVGTEVRPWVGVYLLIGFAALVLAGGVGVDGLARDVRQRSFSWLQPVLVLAGAVVGLVTALAAGWWVWAGASGPIDRAPLDALPPYVVNALKSDARVRVLAVDLSGPGARVAVLADDQTRLGDADRGFSFGGSSVAPATVADLAARMVAGTADSDIAPQLRGLGVGFVWVTGADDDDEARIDNTPGLGPASGNERATVWQLQPSVSRATLADGQELIPIGPPPVRIDPGEPVRLLRLGEASDPRWEATLDGLQVTGVTDGWQQAFRVPAAGGVLDYRLRSVTHWFLFAQGLLLAVAAVLAAPGIRRPEVRDPTRTARRAAVLGGLAP